MPESFVVPQFIEAEDRIFGPITARQFIILLVTGLLGFGFFKLLSFVPFLLVTIPLIIIGGTFAFARINGQAFHYFTLNLLQTFKRPRLRVWEKAYSDHELRLLMRTQAAPPPPPPARKAPVASSRLNELILVVNTGGVYKPEE